MSSKVLSIAGVALVVLVAAGLLFQNDDEAAVELLVRPQQGPFQSVVTATGELQAKNSVQIYGPRRAQQARIFEMKILRLVPEGTVVGAGDFVAELDRSQLTSSMKDVEIEVQKAESRYTQAKLDTALALSRARDNLVDLRYAMEEARLRSEQSVYEPPTVRRQAEIDYEKAQRSYERAVDNYDTEVQQSRAQMQEVGADLQQARNRYDDLQAVAAEFTVMAPDDGMVIYHRSRRGERLTEGGTINAWNPVVAELPDLRTMESVTYINEVDIQRIQPGLPVEITLDAMPDRVLTGTVTNVANIGEQRPNSDAKVFEVRILLAEADSSLRPAMTTANTIIVDALDQALYLPLETVHVADSLSYVFVKQGRSVMRQQVELGLMNENQVVVTAGVAPDTEVYLSVPADTQGLPLRRLASDAVAADPRALAGE